MTKRPIHQTGALLLVADHHHFRTMVAVRYTENASLFSLHRLHLMPDPRSVRRCTCLEVVAGTPCRFVHDFDGGLELA